VNSKETNLREKSLMTAARWRVRYKDERRGSVGDGKAGTDWCRVERRTGHEEEEKARSDEGGKRLSGGVG